LGNRPQAILSCKLGFFPRFIYLFIGYRHTKNEYKCAVLCKAALESPPPPVLTEMRWKFHSVGICTEVLAHLV
jgi:hypothetical protein